MTTGKTGCIISAYTKKERKMRDEILAKLAEVDDMLQAATLDGEQLTDMDCFAELEGALHKLTEAVDYYVD